MTNTTYNLTGMKCMGCVANVEKTLCAIEGVVAAKADLKAQTATVEFDETKVGFAQMREAIASKGFEMTE